MKQVPNNVSAAGLIDAAVDLYGENNIVELFRRADEYEKHNLPLYRFCSIAYRGLALEQTHKFAEARDILEPLVTELRAQNEVALYDFLPVLNILCRCYGTLGDFDKLFTLATEMLQIANAANNPRQSFGAERLLGLYHFNSGNYTTALEHFSSALQTAHAAPLDKDVLADITELCSRTLQVLGDFETSLTLAIDALVLSESIPLDFSRPAIYTNIGSIHSHMQKYNEALEYFHNALDASRQMNFQYGIAHAEYMIGSMYHNLGAQNLAINHASKALEIATTTQAPQIIHVSGLAYFLLAKVFNLLGNATRSREFAAKSLEICKSINYAEQIIHIHILLGAVALRSNETQEAIREFTSALTLAEQTSTKPNILSAHEYLALCYKQNGNLEKVEYHTQKAQELSETILGNSFNAAYEHFFNTYEATKSKRLAALLGVHDAGELDMLYNSARYSTESQKQVALVSKATATIVVKTLGVFSVTVAGREVTPKDWQRKKARDVFKVLLMYHKRALSADYIIQRVWGDDAGTDTIGSFRNAISYIRTALEPNLGRKEASAYLSNISGAYMLDLGAQAWIDFIAFKELLSRAEQANNEQERLQLWEQAIALYAGEFLSEDINAEWATFEREAITDAYIRALLGVARISAERGESDKALTCTKQILSTDRTYEEAYKIMLTVLRNNGNTIETRRIAEQCKAAFLNELGVEPEWLIPFLTT